MDALLSIAVVMLLVLAYYWSFHVVLLGAYRLFFSKERNSAYRRVVMDQPEYIMIIPTFGKRIHILKKLESWVRLQAQCEDLATRIKKIIVVCSDCDEQISKKIEESVEIIGNNKLYIVHQRGRRGKLNAIKTALNELRGEDLNNTICLISDDNTEINCVALEIVDRRLSKDRDTTISIYPSYQSKLLNHLYRFKRFIHRLESYICNPATIGGELLATKCSNFLQLYDPSLAEDYQLGLYLSSRSKNIETYNSTGVYEPYPSGLLSVAQRTMRVTLGTVIEYSRYVKRLNMRCRYIATAYLISLLSIPLLPLPIFIILWMVKPELLLALVAMLSILFVSGKFRSLAGIYVGAVLSLIYLPRVLYDIRSNKEIDYDSLWKDTKRS